MSFRAGSSDPQIGKLFLRSHGDCFIHATQWWIKYWNVSYTRDGLAIVRVTIIDSGTVFLTTLCPASLPYESVRPGVGRKQYLEIDPRFAQELQISSNTDVMVESIGEVERCNSLILTPLDVRDYDKLENFSEKIDYELTERIRVVSCHHSFPIWIDNLVIPVRVVRSNPSANWVILVPNHTVVELQRDETGSNTGTGISIMSGSSPGQGSSSNSSPSVSTATTVILSPPPTKQMAKKEWDFKTRPKNGPRRKSSSSNRSSIISDSSVDTSPTDDSIDPLSTSSYITQLASNVTKWIFSSNRDDNQEDDRPNRLDYQKKEQSVTTSMDSVGFETNKYLGVPQSGLEKVVDDSLSPVSEQPLLTQRLQLNNEIRHKVPRYSGPNYRGGARPGTSTPDPTIRPHPSVSSGSEPVDSNRKSGHQRWYSEGDLKKSSPVIRGLQRPPAPHMSANVRVQPHPISGICSFNAKLEPASVKSTGYWCQNRLFDIFVHPSTIPEVFTFWQRFSTEPILAEIRPSNPVISDFKESKASTTHDDFNDSKQDSRSVASTTDVSTVSILPSSLVVRLCFANRVRASPGDLKSWIEDEFAKSEEKRSDVSGVEVVVEVGHVVMSDIARQQLGIKNCSPVRLLHVRDEWRISYNDKPNLSLQPLKPEDKIRSIEIKKMFEDWVQAVSHLSGMGAVLVNKQIVPIYRNESGNWVYCRVKINVSSPRHPPQVQYLLATPIKRLLLHIDSLSHSYSGTSLARSHLTQISREPSPSKEETISLPLMSSLNLPLITKSIEQYRSLMQLYSEGLEFLRTMLSQSGRGGALLVCGATGSGGTGCGKTSLARLLCKAVSGYPTLAYLGLIDCAALRGINTQAFKKKLKSHFLEAILNQPSVILLDDLDITMPCISDAQEQVGEEGNASIRKTQVLLDLLEHVQLKGARVVVMATAQNKQQLNSALLQSRGVHIFNKTLEITPPTLEDRQVILSSILTSKSVNILSHQELRAVARRTEGFQAGDLVTLVDKAISVCELRTLYPQSLPPITPSSPTKSRFSPWTLVNRTNTDGSDLELSSTPPSKKNLGTSPSLSTPPSSPLKKHFKNPSLMKLKKTSLASTDSVHTLIQEELSAASRVLYHSSSLSQMRLCLEDFMRALKGFVPISLRGLPLHQSGSIDFSGVGGLTSVKKCLKETLLWPSKYRRLFKQCPIKQRCGVLLYGAPGTGKTMLAGAVAKEFSLNFVSIKGPELLSKYIGASEQAVRDVFTRALSAKPCILFFDEFDSLAPRRGHDNTGVTDRVVNQLLTQLDGVEALQGVYVLAASSRPDLIDPALLRPGRIDRSLLCDMPTQEERKEILKSLARDLPLASGVDLGVIASRAEGMTGADLKAVLYNAQLQAAHEALTSRQEGRESNPTASLGTEVSSTPDMSGRGSSIASGSAMRPLVFNFKQGNVRLKSQLTSSQQAAALTIQRRSSYFGLRQRRSTLTRETVSDNALFGKKKKTGILIYQEHLISALSQVQPSVSKQDLKKYNQIYDKFTGKTKTSLDNVKPTATMA